MKKILCIAFGLTLLYSQHALSEEGNSNPEMFDIDTISCWDLGDADPEDRVSALLLVYGYVAGQRREPRHDGTAIQSALEQTGRLCSANPDMYVSEAIERVMG